MSTTANMAYAGKFSFKGIDYSGVTMPNGTGTPLVDGDAGKTLSYGTAGVEVASAQDQILGVMFDFDKAGAVTMQTAGYAVVTIDDSSAVAVGDYVLADGSGGVELKTSATSGATVISAARVMQIVDATHVVIKLT